MAPFFSSRPKYTSRAAAAAPQNKCASITFERERRPTAGEAHPQTAVYRSRFRTGLIFLECSIFVALSFVLSTTIANRNRGAIASSQVIPFLQMVAAMVRSLSRASVLVLLVATATFWSLPLQAQTRPAGQGQKPAPRRPAAPPATPPAPTAKPPAPSPATVKPAEPAPPPTPVVQDLRMKTVYTAAAQKTESVTYRKGQRERFEFGDIIVLRQPDLKRTVQIMRAANTYMIVADGAPPAPPMTAATPAATPQN